MSSAAASCNVSMQLSGTSETALTEHPCVLFHAHEPTSRLKRRSIVKDGLRNLHVVLDFDHTITSYLSHGGNGERSHECHDMLQHGPYLPDERRRAFRAEIDAVWSDQHEGKLGHISDWWCRFHNAVVFHRITRDDVREAVAASNTVLRPGAAELFDCLRRHGILTTIVSAGVSTIIEEVLGRNGIELHEKARIVANVPVWDDNEVVVAFEEPLIHSRNKEEVLRMMGFSNDGETGSDTTASKNNILLAGNSIGDVVLHGIDHKTSLSFGFLHEDVHDGISEVWAVNGTIEEQEDHPLSEEGRQRLQEYFKHYDVVSCGKQSDFGFLIELLREMEEHHADSNI